MILLANGDSYTYGEELEDRSKAWPFVLGKMLNANKVVNLGLCSGSNDHIKRTTTEYIYSHPEEIKDLLVILGWTSSIRFEAYNKNVGGFVQIKAYQGFRMINQEEHRIIRGKERSKYLKDFLIRHYDSIINSYLALFKNDNEYNNYIKDMLVVDTAIMLKNLGIKYLFFDSLYEQYRQNIYRRDFDRGVSKEYIRKLIDENSNIITETCMDSYCEPYPKGEKEKHPLEEGHKAWANYLKEKLEDGNPSAIVEGFNGTTLKKH